MQDARVIQIDLNSRGQPLANSVQIAICLLLISHILLFVVPSSRVAVAVTVCKVQHHLVDLCLSVGVPAKRSTTSRALHRLFCGGGATRTNYIVLVPTSQLPHLWG